MKRRSLLLPALWLSSCAAAGPPLPAELDTADETCRFCRMAVSEPRLAAQIVAPGEEPLFFDDIGCMRDFLKGGSPLRTGAVAYVADHRTQQWIPASRAIYTRNASMETPMGSHLMAHADPPSRESDPDAREGTLLDRKEIFGPPGPPDGKP